VGKKKNIYIPDYTASHSVKTVVFTATTMRMYSLILWFRIRLLVIRNAVTEFAQEYTRNAFTYEEVYLFKAI